jgi:hypothetical protein
MPNWWFDVYSEEYGTDSFGEYDTKEDAWEAIRRVADNADRLSLSDGVKRFFSSPYERVEDEDEEDDNVG